MKYTKEISITWCDEDVIWQAKQMGIKLTKKKIGEVLDLIKRKHDAELGISWVTLECAINAIA